MKTIVVPKEYIVRLWGKQSIQDQTIYRLMKYLLRYDSEDGVLLHNVITGHIVLLTENEGKALEALPAKASSVMKEMIENHFLVPVNYDEYRTVHQLRKIYQTRETGDAITHYVILPTTFCNAHCFYCYESDYPHIHMTEETAHKLVDYIDEHRKGKNVSISWFGGEPLVGIKRIDQISQELKDRDIPFKATMVSNGYLFDEDIVERCVNLWNLQSVQITLDGTEDVYNKVKAYVNVEENPFQRVLNNIELLTRNGIRVIIRLNLDFYNKDDIKNLIEQLGERYAGNQNVTVYLNMLFNHMGFEPVHHTEKDMIDLNGIIEDYTTRLRVLGISHEKKRVLSLGFSQCMADNPHTVEIQPDGSFCRCEHECVNDNYGNLDDGILDPQKPLIWRETIERSDYCPECSMYPACFLLKRCMNADAPCTEGNRKSKQDHYINLMYSVYQKNGGPKDEKVCKT